MAKRVFYSFHYKPDCHRAAQVRNMGVVDGDRPVSDNDWEAVTSGGDTAIKKWIETQLSGRSCAVVLVGKNTWQRKWVKHEIARAWELGKGVVGVRIHNLKDLNVEQCEAGLNPFDFVKVDDQLISKVVRLRAPQNTVSTEAYAEIKANLASWVETAIEERANYTPPGKWEL